MKAFSAILVALSALSFSAPARAQTTQSVTLNWTAPGDDGNAGTATSYQMRYSTTPVGADTLSWWNAATALTGLPAPQIAGSAETFTTPPLPVGATYYFVMIACDEVPNCSGFSDVAVKTLSDTVPPSAVTDLRGQ